MKPVAFALDIPETLAAAEAVLARAPDSRVMAGGQSLGPMLNLRLARPALVMPIAHLAELGGAEATADAVTLGACVTHAAIADGRTPDIGDRILARIADHIAYRAVRNRGTIGGSLAHADPAADWLCTLTALGASVIVGGGGRRRGVPLQTFVTGAFRTMLGAGEIVHAVRIPRPSPDARWGYVKACRKPGEFAHAMAAVLIDTGRGVRRAVIGAVGGKPLVLEGEAAASDAAAEALLASGLDAVGRHMQCIALNRAFGQAA